MCTLCFTLEVTCTNFVRVPGVLEHLLPLLNFIAQACVQLVKYVLFFFHTWMCPVIPDSEPQAA